MLLITGGVCLTLISLQYIIEVGISLLDPEYDDD